VLLEGLARLFEDAGRDVVAQLGDADGLATQVVEQRPDLVVLDVRMPPSYTDEGAQRRPSSGASTRRSEYFPVPARRDPAHRAPGRTGRFGYLLKRRRLDVEEFVSAAEHPHVVGRMVGGSTVPGLAELTEREREVLQLMAEGLTNAGIAKRMHLSWRTIEDRRVLAVLAHLAN